MTFSNRIFPSFTAMAAVSAMLVACADVHFSHAMPREGEVFSSFPEPLEGVYVDVESSGDKLIIQSHELVLDDIKISLEPGVELKYTDNYYVLNFPDSAGWTLYLGELKNPDRILIYGFNPENEDQLRVLQSITQVDIEYDDEGEVARYLLDPSDAEFREILNQQAFSLIGEFQRRN